MAIFSRRIIQLLINENARCFSRRHIKEHVGRLNRMHLDLTLATEWEVVLLNAFASAGDVVHEKDFGGQQYADIYFQGNKDPKENFLADITSVSDQGKLEEDNPFRFLWEDLIKTLTARNLNP